MEIEKKTAIVFTAHQDDEERAAGYISRLKDAGWKVGIVLWTDGEKGELHGNKIENPELVAAVRYAEFMRSAAFLGVDSYYFMRQGDGELTATSKNVQAAAEILIKEQPQLVLTVDEEDGDSAHNDHLQSRVIVENALELTFGRLPVRWAASIDMMQPFESPSHLVDATPYISKIRHLLKNVYVSQNDQVDITFFERSLKTRGEQLSFITGSDEIYFAEAYRSLQGYEGIPFSTQVRQPSHKNFLSQFLPPSYLQVAGLLAA